MMKKFIVAAVIAVLAMTVSPAMAGVWWQPGDPGTTFQAWDFTTAKVVPSGSGFAAEPEVADNPDPSSLAAMISPVFQGSLTYDEQTGFWGSPAIAVDLEIPNFVNWNQYKEIWVDLGDGVAAVDVVVAAHDGGVTEYDYQILPGQGVFEFGVIIIPNPWFEKINFTVLPAPGVGEVYLDYIKVWTICVPEPATLALLGFGGLLLRRRK